MKTDSLNGIAARRDRALSFELLQLVLNKMHSCEEEVSHDYHSMICPSYRDFAIISSSNEIPGINDVTHINASSAEKSTKASGREKT
jgi:hypothetical protein